MLHIYTSEYAFTGKLKARVKHVLGKNFGGPKMVEQSLLGGLHELGYKYELNRNPRNLDAIAGVLNGIAVLRWAIKQKQAGKIRRLVAGPNIVVLPSHERAVLTDPNIDAIIVPSPWVKESYIKDSPQLANKIFIWPAGVSIPEEKAELKDIDFLIFNKVGETRLVGEIRQQLQGYTVRELTYGKFKQEDYFSLLQRSKHVVYLSASESQGLAMFEAWARNVPVLAWERGFAEAGSITVRGKTGAFYMHERAGRTFTDAIKFAQMLKQLPQEKFEPRAYVSENFNLSISAKNYLAIINNA